MMALAGVAAVRTPRLRALVLAVLLLHCGYGLALHAAAMHFKVPVAIGLQSREDYFKQRVERVQMFAYANQQLNNGSTVFTLDQRSYYLDMPVYKNHWVLAHLAAMPLDERYAWFRAHGIGYILYPASYVEESGNIRDAAQALLGDWLRDRGHYQMHARLEVDDPRGGPREQVLVFRVRAPDEAAAP
jgi:hypothetical protein